MARALRLAGAALALTWPLASPGAARQGPAPWPVGTADPGPVQGPEEVPGPHPWPTLEEHRRTHPRAHRQDPRTWPKGTFVRGLREASSEPAQPQGDPPGNQERTPQAGWVQRSQLGWQGYSRPWPKLPDRPSDLSRGGSGAGPSSAPRRGAPPPAHPATGRAEDAAPWDLGARTGWGGTPPAEVRYGIRVFPGYLDPTDPPPVARPLGWRYVQAELSALFGDFTGFGLAAATPLDHHWYGRAALRFGDLFSEELDSDQCELTLGYRWPEPIFDLWGEAYAELGMRVGEIEDDSATGPRLEVGHRSRIAGPLELQVAVGLDASLPDELHAEELYLSSQLEWAIDPGLALRFESELADVAVFRFVLRHYF